MCKIITTSGKIRRTRSLAQPANAVNGRATKCKRPRNDFRDFTSLFLLCLHANRQNDELYLKRRAPVKVCGPRADGGNRALRFAANAKVVVYSLSHGVAVTSLQSKGPFA